MAIELRPHEALDLWRGALVDSIRRAGPDLSARQMGLMLTVYLTPPPHTVRGLAKGLNVSKPAITRALDRLSYYGYVRRKPDDTDRRSILVQRTVKGSVFLREFAELVVAYAARMRAAESGEAGAVGGADADVGTGAAQGAVAG